MHKLILNIVYYINSHELLECAFSPYMEHLDIYRNPGSAKYTLFFNSTCDCLTS